MKCHLTIVLALALSGCAAVQPDLKRLYAVSSADRFQNPVVLVPGLLSTRLRAKDTGKEIWPGPITNFITFNSLDSLALDIDPETLQPLAGKLEPYALFDSYAGRRYYTRIREALTDAGGYSPALPGVHTPSRQRYYVFLYDWRLDLAQSAATLDRFIEQIRTDYDNPKLTVDIVAHSMGALLTRYYLRYGAQDVLDADAFRATFAGASKVNKVVLLGAPNMGSVSALQAFMTGHRFGTATLPTETIATMPSAYQLLPNPDRDWMITVDGKKWNRDLYSVRTWQDYRWSIYDPAVRARIRKRFASTAEADRYLHTLERYFARTLTRARRFHRAISSPVNRAPVRYIVFGGDCILTPARCLVENINGESVVRLFPHQISKPRPGVDYAKLMLEPGDGSVTKPSLLARNTLDPSIPIGRSGAFDLAYAVLLCDSHNRLTGNITFQDNLLNILLTQETTEDRMQRGELPPRIEPQTPSAEPAAQPQARLGGLLLTTESLATR